MYGCPTEAAFSKLEALRHRQHGVFRRDQKLRVAAVATETKIATRSENRFANQRRRSLHNDAREVPARRTRQSGFVHFAEDIFDIAGIHRRRFDGYEHLAGRSSRFGNLPKGEPVQLAGFFESQCAHKENSYLRDDSGKSQRDMALQ